MAITAQVWKSLFVETAAPLDRNALLAELDSIFHLTDQTLSDPLIKSPELRMSPLFKLSRCLVPSDLPFLLKLCQHPWPEIQIWAMEQVINQDERPIVEAINALLAPVFVKVVVA